LSDLEFISNSPNRVGNLEIAVSGNYIKISAETFDIKTASLHTFIINSIIGSESVSVLSLAIVKLYPFPNLFFKNTLLPEHYNFPSPIIPILSPKKSASSMK
jgi:hypothetical protein